MREAFLRRLARRKDGAVEMLTVSDSKLATAITIIRSRRAVTRCAIGCGGARSRALLPVVSRMGGVVSLSLSDVSTVTISKKPNSFAKLEVKSTATGKLKLTLKGPLVRIPAISTLTCGICKYNSLVYPVVSTEEGRICAKLCSFSRRIGSKARLARTTFRIRRRRVTVTMRRLVNGLGTCGHPIMFLKSKMPICHRVLRRKLRIPCSFTPSCVGHRETTMMKTLNVTCCCTKGCRATRTRGPSCLHISRTRHRHTRHRGRTGARIHRVAVRSNTMITRVRRRSFSST